ncbi:MAG: hypothetical protein ACOC44_14325 [Promethearchaeia archaeon]
MTNDSSELECYLKIIRYFQERENKEKREIWKNSTLIYLMEKLGEVKEDEEQRNTIKNSLILLTSLFENIPPDIYNNRGVHINRFREGDDEVVKEILKQEVPLEAKS